MPTLNIGGQRVKVGDEFLKLSPDQQNATVDEIAKSLPQAQPREQQGPPIPTERSNDIGSRADKIIDMEGGGAFQAANIGRDSMVPFSDEMAAGVGSLRGLANGNGVGEEYQREMEAIKLARERSANEHPVASGVGQGAGIALSVGGAGGAAAQAPSLASTIGASTALSAASGAGEGQGTDRLWNAGKGAAVGAVGGTILGGGAAGLQRLGSGAARAANPAVEAADRLGVPLPNVVASDSKATQMIGQGIGSTFMGSPIRKAVTGAEEALGAKAGDIATSVAPGGSKAAVGDQARTALNDYITKKSPQKVSAAYDKVATTGGKDAMPSTMEVAQDIIDRRKAAGLGGDGAAVTLTLEAMTRPKGMTAKGIQDLRSNLREITARGQLPEGFSKSEANRLYGALTEDLKGVVGSTGGPNAEAAWEAANSLSAKEAVVKKHLTKIVGNDGEASGEAVFGKLYNAAQAGGRANITLLNRAKMSMPKSDWDNLSASIIQHMGAGRDGAFSPDVFVTEYGKKMTDQGKALLFDPKLRSALDDLHTVASKMKESGKFRNFSMTGNAIAGGGVIPALLAAPLTTLGGALGTNIMARILAKPATVRAASGWLRAAQSFGRGSSRTSALALQMATRSLAASIARELGQPSQAPQIEQRILSAH